jgi:heme A synthase
MGLMVVGAYVAVADYSLACSGWPLCNGEVVPNMEATSVQVIFGHRILAAIVGVLLAVLLARTWSERPQAPAAFALACGAMFFYVVQVFVGAANIWTEVADEVSTAHLAFGTLLWVMLAMLNIFVHRLYERLPRAAGESPSTGLAGVAR